MNPTLREPAQTSVPGQDLLGGLPILRLVLGLLACLAAGLGLGGWPL